MPGIACKSVDSAGGVQLNGGQGFCRINGDNIVLLGDPVQGHGNAPHASPVMVEASSFVRINGVAVCIEGNAASCGHTSTGRGFARISN